MVNRPAFCGIGSAFFNTPRETGKETMTMKPTPIKNSISHLVIKRRNETAIGDCEMLVDGFGWCRFSNRLCAILINHEWWIY
jgi:hypothetical protein